MRCNPNTILMSDGATLLIFSLEMREEDGDGGEKGTWFDICNRISRAVITGEMEIKVAMATATLMVTSQFSLLLLLILLSFFLSSNSKFSYESLGYIRFGSRYQIFF